MSEGVDLKAKFPHLRPISGAPSLGTVNGIGVTIYGHRDADSETGTYVTSRCLVFVFIPVYWLDAYRVQPAGGNSYYFLGREPLSTFCKAWNLFLISTVLVLSCASIYDGYTKSPEYVAGKLLEQARTLKAEGQHSQSLAKYAEVVARRTSHAADAQKELEALIAERFDSADAAETATMLRLVLNNRQPAVNSNEAAQWYKRAIARVKALSESDAKGSRSLLKTAEPLAADKEAHGKLSEELLEKAVSQNPGDMTLLSEFAGLLEARQDTAGLKKLLEPKKDKLGGTEAARILGQIYAREGNVEGSFPLLEPYTTARLNALNTAWQNYEAMHKQVADGALATLRNGKASQAWYQTYDAASESAKQELVNKYITDALASHSGMKSAEKRLSDEARIVPVALDFGIVRLHRAQGMSDATAKKKELEAAERVFLAIRGTAGDSDEYMLYYGQVLLWLGRVEEGQKQFDQLLAKNNRDPKMLLLLSRILRELGDIHAALKLMDEGYAATTDAKLKYQIASHRAIVSQDLEERIFWLGRADPNEAHVRAELNQATGNKAMRDGDRAVAASHYREALKIYEGFPRNATSLNNTAIIYHLLFEATGRREEYMRCVDTQLEALGLDPKDSILMLNTAVSLTQRAMLEMMGTEVDFARTGTGPYIEHLGLLYSDAVARTAIERKLAENKDIMQAQSILQRLLLLAPRSEQGYAQLQKIYRATGNIEGMRELRERLKGVALDTEHSRKEAVDFQKKGVRPELLAALKSRRAKCAEEMKSLPQNASPLSRALALDSMNDIYWQLFAAKEPPDFDTLVQSAAQAYAVHPASNTLHNLFSAHCGRASYRLAQSRPEWKKCLEEPQKRLNLMALLAEMLAGAGEQKATLLQDPDVKRLLELARIDFEKFPQRPEIKWVKLVQQADPAFAAKMAEALKKSERMLLRDEIEFLLSPYSASDAVDLYWQYELRGQTQAAQRVKKSLTDSGIEWPLK